MLGDIFIFVPMMRPPGLHSFKILGPGPLINSLSEIIWRQHGNLITTALSFMNNTVIMYFEIIMLNVLENLKTVFFFYSWAQFLYSVRIQNRMPTKSSTCPHVIAVDSVTWEELRRKQQVIFLPLSYSNPFVHKLSNFLSLWKICTIFCY